MPADLRADFRAALTAVGWTAEELAARLGLCAATIRGWQRRDDPPRRPPQALVGYLEDVRRVIEAVPLPPLEAICRSRGRPRASVAQNRL